MSAWSTRNQGGTAGSNDPRPLLAVYTVSEGRGFFITITIQRMHYSTQSSLQLRRRSRLDLRLFDSV